MRLCSVACNRVELASKDVVLFCVVFGLFDGSGCNVEDGDVWEAASWLVVVNQI